MYQAFSSTQTKLDTDEIVPDYSYIQKVSTRWKKITNWKALLNQRVHNQLPQQEKKREKSSNKYQKKEKRNKSKMDKTRKSKKMKGS